MFIKFVAILTTAVLFQSHAYDKHSLEWPAPISSNENKIGPILHQYQSFGEVYFHEGVDILVPADQNIFTPVGGLIDAGYYAYKTLSNGLSQKTYLSIRNINREDKEPKLWGERYFEVSVTDADGLRFEIHHINRNSLNNELLNLIYTNASVPLGFNIGSVIEWPTKVRGVDYSHIHYSILNSLGQHLNPFWHSTKIPDSVPPTVSTVYASVAQACPANGLRQLKSISQLTEFDEVTHLVFQSHDLLGENSFPHPPTSLKATFENGFEYSFDYSTALFTNPLNSFNLDELYVGKFCIGAPDFPFVIPGSENFKFYVQIPVPKKFHGTVEVLISDFSKNTTELQVEL